MIPARNRQPLFVFALAVTVAGAACGTDRAPKLVAGPEAHELLINRNWLDRWPKTDREQLHVYRFTPAMGGGVFQDRTLFAGQFELFQYSIHDRQIRFVFPHTEESLQVPFAIERVDGPAPFDLRLTLRPSPRGPDVYYGRAAESGAAGDIAEQMILRRE
jgi:hypothetical protein